MKWTNTWTDVKLFLLPLPFLHPPTPCCFCLSSRFHGDGGQQHSDWKHLSCEWVGGKSCFASSFLTPFLTFFLHSLFLPRSTLVLVNKPLHHVILPIPFTLLTGNQLMSEMVGGLHNGILFFFFCDGVKRRVVGEADCGLLLLCFRVCWSPVIQRIDTLSLLTVSLQVQILTNSDLDLPLKGKGKANKFTVTNN